MFFLAYVVTFLGQLHLTRNYFFTVNTSGQQLLLQSNQFDTTVTFSEQFLFGTATFSEGLLLLNNYSFKTVTYSEQRFYRQLLSVLALQGCWFFIAATLGRQICSEYWYPQKNFFFKALLQSIKFCQRCIQNLFKYLRWNVFASPVNDFKPLTIYAKNTPSQMFQGVLNLFFQNSHFFNKVTYSKETFSEQLLFQKCCFFRKAIERNIYFFRAASF